MLHCETFTIYYNKNAIGIDTFYCCCQGIEEPVLTKLIPQLTCGLIVRSPETWKSESRSKRGGDCLSRGAQPLVTVTIQ